MGPHSVCAEARLGIAARRGGAWNRLAVQRARRGRPSDRDPRRGMGSGRLGPGRALQGARWLDRTIHQSAQAKILRGLPRGMQRNKSFRRPAARPVPALAESINCTSGHPVPALPESAPRPDGTPIRRAGGASRDESSIRGCHRRNPKRTSPAKLTILCDE